MKRIEHYNFISQCIFETSQNFCEELLFASTQKIIRQAKILQRLLDIEINTAKQCILTCPKLLNIPESNIKELIQNVRLFLGVPQETAQRALIKNISLCTLTNHDCIEFLKSKKDLLKVSSNDLADILTLNNLTNKTTKQITEKLELIKTFCKTEYQATTLCRICGILNLSTTEISQNQNIMQKINKFSNIFEYFSIFNCSFAENEQKLKLLKKINMQDKIIYLDSILASTLAERMNNAKNSTNITKCLFTNYLSTKNFFQSKVFAKQHLKTLIFNKKLKFFDCYKQNTNFPMQIGKRCRISKEYKENAKALAHSQTSKQYAFKKHLCV